MRLRQLVAAIALCGSGMAMAAPVTWYLDGVSFADGGTVSGSFVYDAAANQYSNISITTSTGSVRSGDTYEFPTVIATAWNVDFLSTAIPAVGTTNRFILYLQGAMTDAGGTIDISEYQEFTCLAGCTFATGTEPGLDLRFSQLIGSITTEVSDVPEPGSLALIGLGLAGIVAARRRKRA